MLFAHKNLVELSIFLPTPKNFCSEERLIFTLILKNKSDFLWDSTLSPKSIKLKMEFLSSKTLVR